MVGYFASATAPDGLDNDGGSTNQAWLPCDGRALNTFTWRRLHAVISDTFGGSAFAAGTTDQPGATTTFNIPELRGQFVRGWNDQETDGLDPDRDFGSAQVDELRSHTHTHQQWTFQNTATQPGPSGGGTNVPANTGATGGDETRPTNVALLPMIKT
jgi:microcystin-dependent protein